MTSVPFFSTGPGQKARAVLQVMGRNGDIYNPSGIRYLPIEQSPQELIPGGFPQISAALGYINLVATVANIGLSAATLMELRQVHSEVRRVAQQLHRVEEKIDQIDRRVERIDAGVGEQNLRSSLKHITELAWKGDHVDLVALGRVRDEITKFEACVGENHVGENFGLILSADVVDRLQSFFELMQGLRQSIFTQHNLMVRGNPRMVLADREDDDIYFPRGFVSPRNSVVFAQIQLNYDVLVSRVLDTINERFTFADGEDIQALVGLFDESGLELLKAPLFNADPAACGVALSLLNEVDPGKDFEASVDFVHAYRSAWLWETHAGLVHRVGVESAYLNNGYFLGDSEKCRELASRSPLYFGCDLSEEGVEVAAKEFVSSGS